MLICFLFLSFQAHATETPDTGRCAAYYDALQRREERTLLRNMGITAHSQSPSGIGASPEEQALLRNERIRNAPSPYSREIPPGLSDEEQALIHNEQIRLKH